MFIWIDISLRVSFAFLFLRPDKEIEPAIVGHYSAGRVRVNGPGGSNPQPWDANQRCPVKPAQLWEQVQRRENSKETGPWEGDIACVAGPSFLPMTNASRSNSTPTTFPGKGPRLKRITNATAFAYHSLYPRIMTKSIISQDLERSWVGEPESWSCHLLYFCFKGQLFCPLCSLPKTVLAQSRVELDINCVCLSWCDVRWVEWDTRSYHQVVVFFSGE